MPGDRGGDAVGRGGIEQPSERVQMASSTRLSERKHGVGRKGPVWFAWLGAVALLLDMTPVAASEGDGREDGDGPVLMAALIPESLGTPSPLLPRVERRDDTEMSIELWPSAGTPESLMRVLASRSPSDPRWYPSPFQVAPYTVSVSGEVRSSETGLATVYVRVVDASHPSTDMPDSGMLVELRDSAGSLLSRGREGTWRLTSETPGRFELTARLVSMDGRPPVAGSAFFLEASDDAGFSCGDTCPRTGTFRLWRRVLLELDSMYREGATVSGAVPAGVTEIAVDDVRPFRNAKAGRPLEVRLIGAAIPGVAGRREEVARVVGVVRPDRRSRGGTLVLASPARIELDEGDAVVVPSAGVFPMPSIETAKAVFTRAYVELVEIENPNALVPHQRFRVENRGLDFNAFAQRWSDYGSSDVRVSRNVVMIVSADHKTQQLPSGDETMHPAIGSCNIRPAPVNNVFLWRGAVEQQVKLNEKGIGIGGLKPDDVMDELIVHETAHLFGLEDCDTCERRQNDEGTGLSTMSAPVGPEMGDGISGFHASEYSLIRRSADPLPQG